MLATGKAFAFFVTGRHLGELIGGYVVTETELFYLTLLVFLVLIINLIITVTESRRGDKSHR